MNPTEYLRILVRRGWILILAAVLVAGSAFAFSKLQTPVYRATQQILVKPARADYGLSQTLVNLLNSYASWMSTRNLAGRVIDTLKLDMTPEQLKGMVTVSVDRNSNLLTVDVDMKEPNIASDVAHTYGILFQQWREQENQPNRLEDRINAELLDVPVVGLRSSTTVNTVAGGLLGLLLGGVFVFIIETLSANVMRRGADIERYLELPVLGSIPETDIRGA